MGLKHFREKLSLMTEAVGARVKVGLMKDLHDVWRQDKARKFREFTDLRGLKLVRRGRLAWRKRAQALRKAFDEAMERAAEAKDPKAAMEAVRTEFAPQFEKLDSLLTPSDKKRAKFALPSWAQKVNPAFRNRAGEKVDEKTVEDILIELAQKFPEIYKFLVDSNFNFDQFNQLYLMTTKPRRVDAKKLSALLFNKLSKGRVVPEPETALLDQVKAHDTMPGWYQGTLTIMPGDALLSYTPNQSFDRVKAVTSALKPFGWTISLKSDIAYPKGSKKALHEPPRMKQIAFDDMRKFFDPDTAGAKSKFKASVAKAEKRGQKGGRGRRKG